MTNQSPLRIEKDAHTAILTFNRPEVHNALDTQSLNGALTLVQGLRNDRQVQVLILTGAGKAFIAGADIAEMRDKTPEQARAYAALGHRLMHSIARLDKPVLAAINGYCLGGGMEVALAADIRIASERARFGLPETILGIIPGWGALPRATRLLGAAMTKELVFTGDHIDARRALDIGLVNQAVPHKDLMRITKAMANRIARQSPFAVSRAKDVIDAGADLALADACSRETDAFVACFQAGDYREGMEAFLDKREPRFR